MSIEQCTFRYCQLNNVPLGAELIIRDAEDNNEVLGTLSKESIDKGLYRMLNEGREELNDIRSGQADVETYDVMFQYFVLGEIVFG